MTKRKWRRERGKIIARMPKLTALRRLRYSSYIMKELVYVYSDPPPKVSEQVSCWYE